MLRAITMTGYRRPVYTRTVLDALAQCDGIADWVLLPSIDPGNEEVAAAFDDWSACEVRPIINPRRFGLNENSYKAVHRGLEVRADITLHLEDDTVLSPDGLKFFEWAVCEVLIPDRKSPDGHQILLASGYNKPKSRPLADQSLACATRPIWTPWGWAVDKRRLAWLILNWCFRNPKCFTCQFRSQYRRTRREVFPQLSRVQNIGYELGENNRSPRWYRDNHRTPWVATSRSNQQPTFVLPQASGKSPPE